MSPTVGSHNARFAKSTATVRLTQSYEKSPPSSMGDENKNSNTKSSTNNNVDWDSINYRKLEKTEQYREDVMVNLHREITQRRNQRKAQILRQALVDSRDAVLHQAREKMKSTTQKYFPRLTSNDAPQPRLTDYIFCRECSDSPPPSSSSSQAQAQPQPQAPVVPEPVQSSSAANDLATAITSTEQQQNNDESTKSSAASARPVTVRMRLQRNNAKTQLVSLSKSIMLEGTHDPNPKSNATIFLKAHYATEDEKNLTYVPYFGDDDREDVVSELYNLEGREKLMEFGPEYLERDTNDVIDETLLLLQERLDPTRLSPALLNDLHDELAHEMDVSIERIHERHTKVILGRSSGGGSHNNTTADSPTSVGGNGDNKTPSPVSPGREKHHYQQQDSSSASASLSSPSTIKKNSSTLTPLSYMDVMDSYRSIFCRRCFSYDCNMHGNLGKPSLDIQGELAVAKEREGHWEDMEEHLKMIEANKEKQNTQHDDTTKETNLKKNGNQGKEADGTKKNDQEEEAKQLPGSKIASILLRKRPFSSIMTSSSGSSPSPQSLPHGGKHKRGGRRSRSSRKKIKSLTPLQQSVCERALLMFQGDIDKMARTLDAPRDLVATYVQNKNLTIKQEFSHVKIDGTDKQKRKKETNKTSMKNYNVAWLRRVEDAEIHPLFIPCDHEGPCSEENCSCVKNAFFCTKHCVWGEKSRNFFRGCACKGGKCGTKSCACFAAKRECDPDLCRTCGACTDPPNQPATKQKCRNDNIGMRRHCHLLLAKSTIENAGWGIYTKHALKKGDFVHEYVGEVISQEEAERRGRIYDKVNRSYLFNLSSDYVVDASRKGNKTRFANHSSKPNCYTKMVNVNGDIRIGLFAKEDVEPQSELFFDYRYDVGLDNDLIVKPGKTVDWMKDPKMANQISKKNPNKPITSDGARIETKKH